jgi:hypothetical protein
MSDGNFTLAKIVSTPTDNAWSQAYSAGKLFTVLSLKKEVTEEESLPTEEENPGGEESLKAIGKKVLDSLEAEFFTLEEKNLQSIKQAISSSVSQIPKDIEFSFVTAVLSGNILYAYGAGLGKVFIKRGDKFGPILEAPNGQDFSSVSGFLQNGDLVVIETAGFCEVITAEALFSSLDSLPPSEIAEGLAPTIHEAKEATAASIILSYKEEAQIPSLEENIQTEEILTNEPSQEAFPSEKSKSYLGYLSLITSHIPKLKEKIFLSKNPLSHPKKMYLTVAVLIVAVLLISIFLGIKRQESAKTQALFNSIYPQAQKKYDEGVSLKDLNQNLAKDSFNSAKKILDDGKSKFSANSSQEKQINSLLENVNKELSSSEASPSSLDKSKLAISVENGSGVKGAAAKASDFLKGLGYNVISSGNADKATYVNMTIKVKSSAKAYLDGLKSDLSKNYTIGNATSDLPTTSPSDAVVIIGK